MPKDIDLWLNNSDRTFNEGLILFEKYGNNNLQLDLFKSNVYKIDRLKNELLIINTKFVEQKEIKEPIGNFPPHVQIIQNNNKEKYKIARDLHSKLLLTLNKNERYTMAAKILELMEQVRKGWYQVDFFISTGKLPSEFNYVKNEKPSKKDTLIELVSKIKNIPTNISRLEKKLKVTTDTQMIEERCSLIRKNQKDLDEAWKRLHFLNDYIENHDL